MFSNFFFFFNAQLQRGNSHLAHLRGNSQPRTLDLARDVMQLHCTSSLHGRHHPAGIHSLLPDSDYTCSHDVTLRIAKTNLAVRGVLHASTCALPVRNLRRALCEQSTPRRSRRVSNTRVRVGNPSSPNPATQPGLCPSAGSATSTAGVPGPGLTLAAEHVGVSCVARHGLHARCCANPARSPMKLQPLPGLCLSNVALVASFHPTHTCVSRRPDCTTLN